MGTDLPPFRAITRAFELIARTNTMLGSQRCTDPDTPHSYVPESRSAYQQLITTAILAQSQNQSQSHDDDAEDSAMKSLTADDMRS